MVGQAKLRLIIISDCIWCGRSQCVCKCVLGKQTRMPETMKNGIQTHSHFRWSVWWKTIFSGISKIKIEIDFFLLLLLTICRIKKKKREREKVRRKEKALKDTKCVKTNIIWQMNCSVISKKKPFLANEKWPL